MTDQATDNLNAHYSEQEKNEENSNSIHYASELRFSEDVKGYDSDELSNFMRDPEVEKELKDLFYEIVNTNIFKIENPFLRRLKSVIENRAYESYKDIIEFELRGLG